MELLRGLECALLMDLGPAVRRQSQQVMVLHSTQGEPRSRRGGVTEGPSSHKEGTHFLPLWDDWAAPFRQLLLQICYVARAVRWL